MIQSIQLLFKKTIIRARARRRKRPSGMPLLFRSLAILLLFVEQVLLIKGNLGVGAADTLHVLFWDQELFDGHTVSFNTSQSHRAASPSSEKLFFLCVFFNIAHHFNLRVQGNSVERFSSWAKNASRSRVPPSQATMCCWLSRMSETKVEKNTGSPYFLIHKPCSAKLISM